MTAHKKGPPVPPASRTRKGPGSDPKSRQPNTKERNVIKATEGNPQEQGQQGNIHQNIHNQGNRQAR
jgi:hypothetical protein